MTHHFRFLRILLFTVLSAVLALGQTNITLNLTQNTFNYNSTNSLIFAQTGSVGSLGNATLVATSSSWPIGDNGITGPVKATLSLSFNLLDTIRISYTIADPNFPNPQNFTMAAGTITGGTGIYAGATGSLTLNVAKTGDTSYNRATTNGSGSLTVGGTTTPLILANFVGWAGALAPLRERDIMTGDVSVTGTLGSASGTITGEYGTPPVPMIATVTIAFNATDHLNIWFNYAPDSNYDPPASFTGFLAGGTGKYQTAGGVLTITSSPGGSKFVATGTLTTQPSTATVPIITQVKTVYGLPQVAFNTWIQINGTNLVPANTPSSGVDWSNAPEFANGQMPTQLGPISVGIQGSPAYIYYYCSAATNPLCATDQINVLAPLLPLGNEGPSLVLVNNGGVTSGPQPLARTKFSPAFFPFDTKGHIVARHQDFSLVGPTSLYPGLTTPAKPGEIISVVGSGFGGVTSGPITAGSATQSGPILPAAISCGVSGVDSPVAAALASPGLYQVNITIPKSTPSGDNLLSCVINGYESYPGILIAVQ